MPEFPVLFPYGSDHTSNNFSSKIGFFCDEKIEGNLFFRFSFSAANHFFLKIWKKKICGGYEEGREKGVIK